MCLRTRHAWSCARPPCGTPPHWAPSTGGLSDSKPYPSLSFLFALQGNGAQCDCTYSGQTGADTGALRCASCAAAHGQHTDRTRCSHCGRWHKKLGKSRNVRSNFSLLLQVLDSELFIEKFMLIAGLKYFS